MTLQLGGPALAVLNAGSSSLKFSLFGVTPKGELPLLLRGQLMSLNSAPEFTAYLPDGSPHGLQTWPASSAFGHAQALDFLLDYLNTECAAVTLLGVGHRVVHGGLEFAGPTLVSQEVLAALETLIPLAPLHQPHNLAAIRRLAQSDPTLRQVACFDTAFHRSGPELAQMFGLPHALHQAGVRRYGFHGLSFEYLASVLPTIAPAAAAGKTLLLHLGHGASICALEQGRSVASSMGFTALDGLLMGTRCGALDPGVLLHLLRQPGMDGAALEHLLYLESGLLGVSGISADMRVLLASPEPRARLAVDLFVYRIQREIGSLVAALGGLDALVFSAGIGEHAAEIRRRVCAGLGWLGLALDVEANRADAPCRISQPASRCSAWVVPTNEELMIARHTWALLGQTDQHAARG